MEKKKVSFGARVKERFRKLIVSLKHKPHTIPMVMLVITFIYYSLNLTNISNATATVNEFPMGLCGFIAMLFSMLALVCFMNAFPNRKPVNKPMLILMIAMMLCVLGSDIVYSQTVLRVAGTTTVSPSKAVIMNGALQVLSVHTVLIVVSLALVALLPVYSKLIRKINTSIEVEAGENMSALELSGED